MNYFFSMSIQNKLVYIGQLMLLDIVFSDFEEF